MMSKQCLSAVIVLAMILLAGCEGERPLSPRLRPAAAPLHSDPRVSEPFFVAWTEGPFVTSPIQTIQSGTLNAAQCRESWVSFTADPTILSFAAATPGRLYIHGDEPDQPHRDMDPQCTPPAMYARLYHDFVDTVLTADPTAKFSPAGFAEPNDLCCPPPPSSCHDQMHSINYAQQFYDQYVALYGTAPHVDEWRFHDFGNDWGDDPHSQTYDLGAWENRVDGEATWSINHGAHKYLGS
jgi:hypothetical protein